MAPFFETFWSKERLCCLPGGRLAGAVSCRESANRVRRTMFVSYHSNLNSVIVDKLTMGAPLLISDSLVQAHQRSLMAV
jgi:hypothetical protein